MLCEDMAMEHKGRIVGIDISETVINEMNEKHKQKMTENPTMYIILFLFVMEIGQMLNIRPWTLHPPSSITSMMLSLIRERLMH